MKPKLETFRKAVEKYGGNITLVAKSFKVTRSAVYLWLNQDEGFKQAVNDIRGNLFDECLTTARIIALGIPEKDANGKFIGWLERPDPHMIRYILSTLGKQDGFGESIDITSNGKEINNFFRVLDKDEIENFKRDFDKEY